MSGHITTNMVPMPTAFQRRYKKKIERLLSEHYASVFSSKSQDITAQYPYWVLAPVAGEVALINSYTFFQDNHTYDYIFF